MHLAFCFLVKKQAKKRDLHGNNTATYLTNIPISMTKKIVYVFLSKKFRKICLSFKSWSVRFLKRFVSVSSKKRTCILLTSSNNQIYEFRIPNILFTCLIKGEGETLCNLYIEITQPFLILSKSQRSLKMCSQNH